MLLSLPLSLSPSPSPSPPLSLSSPFFLWFLWLLRSGKRKEREQLINRLVAQEAVRSGQSAHMYATPSSVCVYTMANKVSSPLVFQNVITVVKKVAQKLPATFVLFTDNNHLRTGKSHSDVDFALPDRFSRSRTPWPLVYSLSLIEKCIRVSQMKEHF